MKRSYFYEKRKETFNDIFEKVFTKEGQTLFTEADLKDLQSKYGVSIRMSSYLFDDFVEFLTSKNFLAEISFITSDRVETTKRVWASKQFNNKSDYEKFIEILQTAYPKGYFTHYTAMRYHKLTDQLPKVIYINQEQQYISNDKVESVKRTITQEAIDKALQKKAREREETLSMFNHTAFKIAGKSTQNIGVSSGYIGGLKVKMTTIERTLVDAVVHQEFSGGIGEVIGAYQRAYELDQSKESNFRFSIRRSIRILKKLNYIYPYHQAVGYLLERVGFDTDKFKKGFEMTHDFYLVRGKPMSELEYNADWRLYIPKTLNQLF